MKIKLPKHSRLNKLPNDLVWALNTVRTMNVMLREHTKKQHWPPSVQLTIDETHWEIRFADQSVFDRVDYFEEVDPKEERPVEIEPTAKQSTEMLFAIDQRMRNITSFIKPALKIWR